jgi:hypothetical protein
VSDITKLPVDGRSVCSHYVLVKSSEHVLCYAAFAREAGVAKDWIAFVGGFMRVFVITTTLILAGFAAAPPPPPVPIEQNPYYQDMRKQLGIDRAEQRQELCTRLPRPSIGMTGTQVLSSCWGKPDHVAESITAQGKQAIWAYLEGQLYLTNDVVTRIVTSR